MVKDLEATIKTMDELIRELKSKVKPKQPGAFSYTRDMIAEYNSGITEAINLIKSKRSEL